MRGHPAWFARVVRLHARSGRFYGWWSQAELDRIQARARQRAAELAPFID